MPAWPRPSPRGHAQVKFIGKGDHFGEEALLEQRHRVETVRALGSSDLTVLSQAAFARVEELFPVALACARRLLRDLPKLEEQHPDVVAGFEDDRSLDFLEMDAGQRRLVRSVRLLRRAGIGAEEDAALVHASEFGGEPPIDTNQIETQVLVDNGQTVVLGGILTTEQLSQIAKTPLLGDLPILGRLFRYTEESNEKVELLVFITPRLLDDGLAVR